MSIFLRRYNVDSSIKNRRTHIMVTVANRFGHRSNNGSKYTYIADAGLGKI